FLGNVGGQVSDHVRPFLADPGLQVFKGAHWCVAFRSRVWRCSSPIAIDCDSSCLIKVTSSSTRGSFSPCCAAISITGSYWVGTSVGRFRTAMSRQIPERVLVWVESHLMRPSVAAALRS